MARCFWMLNMILALFGSSWAQTEKRFIELLTDARGYDKYVSPLVFSRVHVGLHLNSIIDVNDQSQEMEVDMYLRLYWFDPRLYHDPVDHEGPVILHDGLASRIWQPDLYFENARKVEMETLPVQHRLVKFYSSGRVWMATRYRLRLACLMDFQKFPFDTQLCHIQLQDYSHTTAETDLAWFNDTDPFTVSSQAVHMRQFRLTNSYLADCKGPIATASHPCLKVSLELRRTAGYSLRQYYLPMILLLVANYFSLLLGRNIPHVRLSYLLIILILMCTTALTSSLAMSVPKVSYFTLYDYWMAVSFMLYFLTVLHFAVVMMVRHRSNPAADYLCGGGGGGKGRMSLIEETGEGCSSDNPGGHRHAPPSDVSKPHARTARYLDFLGIIIYPAVLLLFLVIYWMVALGGRSNTSTTRIGYAGDPAHITNTQG